MVDTGGHGSAGELPLERVESEITMLSAQIAAASARLLASIAEYDRREGWAGWGCRSTAHWLSWRCGDSLHTAREKVRVARALSSLPVIGAAFAAGELSYSKVRAVSRVAIGADDEEWTAVARHSTGAMLERIVAGVRRSLEDDDAAAGNALAQRSISRCGRGEGVGIDEIRMRLPTDMAETVWAAVEVVSSRQIDEAAAGGRGSRRDVIAERGGMAAVRADAMVEIAERIVASEPVAALRGDVGRLTLVADLEGLQEVAEEVVTDPVPAPMDAKERTLGARHVPAEVARRMACDVVAAVLVKTREGHGCDVGRDTRVVSRRLRRALHRRDHGLCRFPACGASSWLHAHHVVHWADGGRTDLTNLVMVCGFHHRLVHEGGWRVAITDGAVVWSDPLGVPATVEPLGGSADKLVSEIGERLMREPNLPCGPLDFRFVVSVLAEHTARTRERSRPRGDARVDVPQPLPG